MLTFIIFFVEAKPRDGHEFTEFLLFDNFLLFYELVAFNRRNSNETRGQPRHSHGLDRSDNDSVTAVPEIVHYLSNHVCYGL